MNRHYTDIGTYSVCLSTQIGFMMIRSMQSAINYIISCYNGGKKKQKNNKGRSLLF